MGKIMHDFFSCLVQKNAYLCRHENIKFYHMRTHLIKTLLLLFTTLAFMPCFSQQVGIVSFNYDANGNRIIRQFEIGGDRGGTKNGGDKVSPSIDTFEMLSVALYPNPTEGQFSMVIEGKKENAILHGTITTTNGAVIYDKLICDETEHFDLSQQPAGIYLLRLTVGDESHVWRVIKK
jgi:hypothetical protein